MTVDGDSPVHPWAWGMSFGERLAPSQSDLEQAAPLMFVLGRYPRSSACQLKLNSTGN